MRARIAAACERAMRDPRDVTLIAVSKTHAASLVEMAAACGLRDFGENRVQEAVPKIGMAAAADLRWHLVGHLQTNKINAALDAFDILHGIDSERLARAISERATRPTAMMLEVNVAGEASKFGVSPGDAVRVAGAIGRMPHIDLRGLMTVAPPAADAEDVRPVFQTLRALRDAIGLRDLSMGMTDDFDVAIEEGATHIRVGRAIFGARGG